MRKWGIKKKFCFYASISLALFFIVFCGVFAIVANIIENKNKIVVYIPDGAPALACAQLLIEDVKDDGIEYNVVSANGIESHVTSSYESRNADICVLPLTDASLLLSDGEKYQSLGVLTHGNFFLLSENAGESYMRDNLSALVGKKIGFVRLDKIHGLIFRSVLQQAGVEYSICNDLSCCQSNVVNLINIQPASIVKGMGYDLFVTSEPTVSAKISEAGLYEAGNLQELCGESYAQAVIVAKRSVIQEKRSAVDNILAKLRSNNAFIAEKNPQDVLSAIKGHLEKKATTIFTQSNLNVQMLSRYGVYFTEDEQAKREITATVQRIQQINANVVKPFAENFFV